MKSLIRLASHILVVPCVQQLANLYCGLLFSAMQGARIA